MAADFAQALTLSAAVMVIQGKGDYIGEFRERDDGFCKSTFNKNLLLLRVVTYPAIL